MSRKTKLWLVNILSPLACIVTGFLLSIVSTIIWDRNLTARVIFIGINCLLGIVQFWYVIHFNKKENKENNFGLSGAPLTAIGAVQFLFILAACTVTSAMILVGGMGC